MPRPAKIGDKAVVIACPETHGANVGKTCVVREQCCEDDHWACEALEPHKSNCIENFIVFGDRCPAGAKVCYRKRHLIALEDPDPTEEHHADDVLRYETTK